MYQPLVLKSSLDLIFALFCLWSEYWNLLYNDQRPYLWPFVHCLHIWWSFICGCTVNLACWLPHDTLVTGVFSASPFLTVLKCVTSRTSSPIGTNWWGSLYGHLPGFPVGHLGEICAQNCLPPDVGEQEIYPLLLWGPLWHITLSCEGRDSLMDRLLLDAGKSSFPAVAVYCVHTCTWWSRVLDLQAPTF